MLISCGRRFVALGTTCSEITMRLTLASILWTVTLEGLTVDGVASEAKRTCPAVCKCLRNKRMAECSGYGRKLTYIPELPCQVQTLSFHDNCLHNLTTRTFENLTCQDIFTLRLSANRITYVSKNAFSSLKTLTSLDLGDNVGISVEMLGNALGQVSVSNLSLKHIGLQRLDHGLLRHCKELRWLNLEGNHLSSVNDSVFRVTPNLIWLSLKHNKIEQLTLSGHSSLQTLILSENLLIHAPSFCVNNSGKTPFPSLRQIDLNNNHISHVDKSLWSCLKNLTRLSLTASSIRMLKNNTFANLTSLRTLDLTGSKIMYIASSGLNNSHLESLSISYSHIKWTRMTSNLKYIFTATRSLTRLDLSKTSFHNLNRSMMIALFSPLKSLRVLLMKSVELRFLYSGLFSMMANLTDLQLTGNSIASFHDQTGIFKGLHNLRKLYLNSNSIRIVYPDSFSNDLLQSLTVLDLSNNDFDCDCANYWFRNWVADHKGILKQFPNCYICSSPEDLKEMPFLHFKPSAIMCTITRPVLNVIIILCCFCVLLVLFVVAGYRLRWKIRYWIFLCRCRNRGYQEIPDSDEMIYDAIVVSAEEDRCWVLGTLANYLENEMYKLYISDRDCNPTQQETATWLKNFKRSKKVIFVLSSSFLACSVCSFLTNVVIHSSITRGTDIILPIYKEDAKVNEMQRSLLEVLTKTHPPM